MKIKTSEASGVVLDWLVAICEGYKPPLLRVLRGKVALPEVDDPMWCDYLDYSICWELAGPIIDREHINLRGIRKIGHSLDGKWLAMSASFAGTSTAVYWEKHSWLHAKPGAKTPVSLRWQGETALIAAMRCYVASKLGEEAEIPDEIYQKFQK